MGSVKISVHILKALPKPENTDKSRMSIDIRLSRSLRPAEWEWLLDRWQTVPDRPRIQHPVPDRIGVTGAVTGMGARWVGELSTELERLPHAAHSVEEAYGKRDAAWAAATAAIADAVEKAKPATD